MMKIKTTLLSWILLCLNSFSIYSQGETIDKPIFSNAIDIKQYYLELADWYCLTPQFNLDSAYQSLATLEKILLHQKPIDFLNLAVVNTRWSNIYKEYQFYNKARIKGLTALEYYNKTPKKLKNAKLEADIYWLLAISMLYNQEENKAFKYFTKQDSILRNEKDDISKSKYIQNRAFFNSTYFNGDKELALKLFEENIPLLKKLGNYNQLVRNYMVLARKFKAIDDNSKEYLMLRDSVKIYALKAKNPYLQVFYPLELTYAMIVNAQYDEAKEGIFKVLEDMKKYGLDKSNNYQSGLQDLGEIEYKRKNYDKAIEYYKECLEIADSLDIKMMELSLLKIISDIYKEKGDYRTALAFLTKYNEVYELNEKTISDKSTEEYELQISLANQKLVLQKNKSFLGILTIGLFFFIIGLAFSLYNYRKQNKLNKLLQKNVKQKEDLLKEIHHRVKNNLSVISGLLELQSNSLKDNAFELTFKESQNRVKSVALIHQRLYQHESLSSIELSEYIEDLYKQIYNVFKSKTQIVNFKNKVPKTLMDIDTAVPIGLIINELFTNTFKYAFDSVEKGEIEIELLSKEEGIFQLYYKDNGKGLDKDFDFKKIGSFGLKLVNRLCIQLFGKMRYEYVDNHSIFIIDFKDKIGKMKNEQ